MSSAESEAAWIKITPDGTRLMLGSWGYPQTDVLDAGSLEHLARLDGWETITPLDVNGRALVVASDTGPSRTQLAVLDPGALDVLYDWSVDSPFAVWLAVP
jgi:hypothetical protein